MSNSDSFVLGIDLGTSNSVVAVYRNGTVEAIPDSQGEVIQPSVVSFHPDGNVLVGAAAKKRRLIDPTNTIFSAKRLIGRPFRSAEVQRLLSVLPYAITEGPQQQPTIVSRGHRMTVSELSALVLRHMRFVAGSYLGRDPTSAVITVPANFNDTQRQATKAAGQLAGLEVLRIINEPTAAALACGHGRGMDATVLVYDFGGGTFDVTILKVAGEIFEVLSTAGDTQLGGDDIDERVGDVMVKLFMKQHRYDLRHNEISMLRLRTVAEKIKCQLSEKPLAAANIQELAYGPGGKPLNLSFSISKEELEQLMKDLVRKTFQICQEALDLARIRVEDIDDVIMVGGSTRIPLVGLNAFEFFHKHGRSDVNPDQVVAMGAALQGAILSGNLEVNNHGGSTLLLDVTPRALGVATVGGFSSIVIPRNSQVPTEQNRIFATSADYQTSVSIKVCQGESRKFNENVQLGELILAGLKAAPRGHVRVEVTFEIDPDGILKVRARDPDTGNHNEAVLQVMGAPSEKEVLELMNLALPMPEERYPGLPEATPR